MACRGSKSAPCVAQPRAKVPDVPSQAELAVRRLAIVAGVLSSVGVALSFVAVQWLENGAVDAVATVALGLLFMLVWTGLILLMARSP